MNCDTPATFQAAGIHWTGRLIVSFDMRRAVTTPSYLQRLERLRVTLAFRYVISFDIPRHTSRTSFSISPSSSRRGTATSLSSSPTSTTP